MSFSTIRIPKEELQSLYWGESGTPSDWHSVEEISDIMGCTAEAVTSELARHAIKAKTFKDELIAEVWKTIEGFRVEAHFQGGAYTRKLDIWVEPEGYPDVGCLLGFVFDDNWTVVDKSICHYMAEYEIRTLPCGEGTDPKAVTNFVDQLFDHYGFKRSDPEPDDSQDILW